MTRVDRFHHQDLKNLNVAAMDSRHTKTAEGEEGADGDGGAKCTTPRGSTEAGGKGGGGVSGACYYPPAAPQKPKAKPRRKEPVPPEAFFTHPDLDQFLSVSPHQKKT